ncbi:MAG: glycosyltransferase family 39 protein [Actinomycetota bacterium]|nr:glycosyltransferase family 39 protein [Actinomycetota bacterium]
MRAPKRPEPPFRATLSGIPPDVWAVGALILLAALLRFAGIASQSYWADESLTVYEVHLPFGAMLHAVSQNETTPQLYFILAWAWAHLFGTGEGALRSLSALIGVAVVLIAYLCGRELVSRRAGVIAAALAAVNPFLVWYSQEARAYMLLIALTGLSFLWCVRAEREPSRRNVAWWTIFSALAIATHFFAGFLVAPEALWLLWRARSRFLVVACALLAAGQLALVPVASQDTHHGIGWIHAIPLLSRIGQVPTQFAVMTVYRHVSLSEGLWGGAIAIGVAVFLLVLAGGPAERRGARIAATLAAIVIAAPLLLGLARPADDFFLARNLSPAWIPLCVALAAACAVSRARDIGVVVATLLVVMFALATIEIAGNPVFQKADWRGVGHALGTTSEPRAILVVGGQEALALKIFTQGVHWNQPTMTQPLTIDEIDVVGSIARTRLRGPDLHKRRALPGKAPPGAVLLGRRWVRNFDVARYELIRPWRMDTLQISARAGRFFRHDRAPTQLLVLVAGGTPRRGVAPFVTGRPLIAPIIPVRPHRARHARAAHHRRGSHRHASRVAHHGGRRLAGNGNLPRHTVSSRGCLREQPLVVARHGHRCLRARSPR